MSAPCSPSLRTPAHTAPYAPQLLLASASAACSNEHERRRAQRRIADLIWRPSESMAWRNSWGVVAQEKAALLRRKKKKEKQRNVETGEMASISE